MQQHPLGHPTLKKVYYLQDKEEKKIRFKQVSEHGLIPSLKTVK